MEPALLTCLGSDFTVLMNQHQHVSVICGTEAALVPGGIGDWTANSAISTCEMLCSAVDDTSMRFSQFDEPVEHMIKDPFVEFA